MASELALAIQQICDEKNIASEIVKETIESAVASAYRKDFGNKQQNLQVDFNIETGEFDVYDIKEVVEDALFEEYEARRLEIEKIKEEGGDVAEFLNKEKEEHNTKHPTGAEETDDENEEKKFNPKTMITLAEAKEEDPDAVIGDEIIKELDTPDEFGRMAAQTAKQVIIQKIREAERENIYNNFKDSQGELVNGTIQRREGRVILIDLGDATAVMLPQDQIDRENYKSGARMKFYIKSVEQTVKGPEILVSRTHPEILRKLLKFEVPEINSGVVQLKSIAREAGSRSKIAVFTEDEDIDPIGSCIGQRGTRIQTLINDLGGEKIDVIEWDDDPKKFIIKALAPAKIDRVELNEEEKTAKAYVKEDQYSLAIGKQGQNARLAAKLSGWKIDIISEGGIEGDDKEVPISTNTEAESKPEGVEKEENSDNPTPSSEEKDTTIDNTEIETEENIAEDEATENSKKDKEEEK